jgi:hypothetical protein
LFYLFNLERRIPERHPLRWINPIVTRQGASGGDSIIGGCGALCAVAAIIRRRASRR